MCTTGINFLLRGEIGTSRNDINKPLDLDYSLQFLMCKFVITCIECMLQIAKRALVPGLTSESVWDYFVEVILPAILRWQARSKTEVDSPMLGDLLHAVANKVEHVSEVM